MGQSAATPPAERPPEVVDGAEGYRQTRTPGAAPSALDEAEDFTADEAEGSKARRAEEPSGRSPKAGEAKPSARSPSRADEAKPSARSSSPASAQPTSARVTAAPSERIKRVLVSGAGLIDVNGTYTPAAAFAGAEVFVKESTEFGTIYIRRQAEDLPNVWVITLSPTQRESRHLYKRDEVMMDKETPPLLGWVVYPSGDGVEQALEHKLGAAPGRLEYFEVHQKPKDKSSQRIQPDIFRSDTNCLQVCILGASNLQATDDFEPEPYCVCEIPGKPHSISRTPALNATFNPSWKYIFEVEDFESDDVLMFSVKSDDVLLGQATLAHSKIYPKGFVGDVRLEIPDGDPKESLLSLCITPANQEVPGICLELSKSAGNVGVGFVPEMLKNALSIRTIAEGGQIDRWNADHPLEQIKIRDRVVEVNGIKGTCKDLVHELAQSKGPLKIVVKRKMSF